MAELLPAMAYRCAGCGEELDAEGLSAELWVRCPSCGRPDLPPDRLTMEEALRLAEKLAEGRRRRDEITYLDEQGREVAGGPARRGFVSRFVSPLRLLGCVLLAMMGYMLYDSVQDLGWQASASVLYLVVVIGLLVWLSQPRMNSSGS